MMGRALPDGDVFMVHLKETARERWNQISPGTQQLFYDWLVRPITLSDRMTSQLVGLFEERIQYWDLTLDDLMAHIPETVTKIGTIQKKPQDTAEDINALADALLHAQP